MEEQPQTMTSEKTSIDKDIDVLNGVMNLLKIDNVVKDTDDDDVSVHFSSVYSNKENISSNRKKGKQCAADGIVTEEFNVLMNDKAKEMLQNQIDSKKSIREKNSTNLTSEELQLQKLEKEKDEEKKRIKKYRESYMKLRKNGFHSSTRSNNTNKTVKKLTIPRSPTSLLDKKFGKKQVKGVKRTKSEGSMTSSVNRKLSLTIQEPFNFATDQRMKNKSNDEAHTSPRRSQSFTAAELVYKFQNGTRNYQLPVTTSTHNTYTSTMPQSPVLHTKERSESIRQRSSLISQAERDEQVMQDMEKHQFKALKLNYRAVFESNGEFGVPKIQSKENTVPQDFVLRSQKRADEHTKKVQETSTSNDENFNFKARKMPDFAPKCNTKQPSSSFKELTLPESPKFHCKERASSAPKRRQLKSVKEQQQEKQQDKEAWKHKEPMKLTEPKEFELCTTARGESYKQQFLQKIQEEQVQLEKEYFNIKALPLPDLEKHFEVKHERKENVCTEIKEFNLQSLSKHNDYMMRLNEMIMKEIEEETKKTSFKALKLNKQILECKDDPTQDKPVHDAVVPLNIVLESDKRAQRRKEYDDEMTKRKQQEQEDEQRRLQQEQEREQVRLKALRRKSVEEGGMMFKAREILKEDPYATHNTFANVKAPTIPKSPKFRLKERRESKIVAKEATAQKENEKTNNTNVKTMKKTSSFPSKALSQAATTATTTTKVDH